MSDDKKYLMRVDVGGDGPFSCSTQLFVSTEVAAAVETEHSMSFGVPTLAVWVDLQVLDHVLRPGSTRRSNDKY